MQWPLIPTWLGCWDSHHQQQPGRYLEKEGGMHSKVIVMGGGGRRGKEEEVWFQRCEVEPQGWEVMITHLGRSITLAR